MSYSIDDDASQIRDLKDRLDKLQSDQLASQFSVSQENVESGETIVPGANPSARGGSSGGSSTSTIYPIDDQGVKSSGTVTHDLSMSTKHKLKFQIEGDVTVAFSNYPATGNGIDWYVEVTQANGGGHTITWPAAITPAITLTETDATVSLVALHTDDNGTIIRAIALLNAVAIPTEVFTWTANHSAGNFDLLALKDIDFDGASSTITGLHNLQFAQTSQSINSLAGQVSYQGAALDTHSFIAGGTEIARLEEITTGVYQLDMLAHEIKNSREHTFDNSTEAVVTSTEAVIGYSPTTEAGLLINVPTAKSIINKVNDVDITTLSATNLTFVDGHQTIFNPDTTNPGVNIGLVVGDPSATNNGDLWYNSSTNKFRTKENGVNADVISAGTEIALWTVNHDANGNTLILDADGDSSISSVSDDSVQIATGGASELSITNGFVTVPNALIVNGNTTLGNATTDIITTTARFATALNPNADITLDLGINTTNRWRDLWLGRDASILGTIIVGGASTFLGNVQVGDAITDTLTVNAKVVSDIVSDGLNDLGTTANPWNNIVADNTLFCSNFKVFSGDADINVFNDLDMQAGDTVDFADNSTTATAGIRTLPSNPDGFIVIKVNGTSKKVPYYI